MSRLSDPQEHDDLLNYQLKRLVALGGAPAVRLCEGRYGVSRMEWRMLAALVEDGSMSPSALIARVRLDPARVTRTVSSLRDKGLAERRPDATDARRAMLRATAAGERLYAELFPQLAAINRRLMAALDEREALMLETCLRKLTERARAVYEAGGGVEAKTERRLGGSRRAWPHGARPDR